MERACASCGAVNAEGARFCGQCGGALARACARCGDAFDESARFCPACGTPVGGLAPSEREARKVVSALFADVVGSTPLGERLDPEDFSTVVGEAVAHMAAAVDEFGGSVSELAGDGLLALFGAPTSHEDDAERAVRAGLAIVARNRAYAAEVATRWGIEDFSVRVGIETGLAVLGAMGGGDRVQYGAMGDSLNTAARLQAAAPVGGVLVGEHTQRLVGPLFEWGPRVALELKGKGEPVGAFPAVGESEASGTFRTLPGNEAALVGREPELTAIDELVEAAAAGTGGVLVLSGEAGIGKSRLLREVNTRFAAAAPEGAEPPRWLEGRCASYGENVPYLPVRGLLRAWLGVPRTTPPEESDRRLRAEAGALLGDDADAVVPFLGSVLGSAPTEELAGLAPEAIQERSFEAVETLLRRLAEAGPLAVALDDLHWADATSLALVARLLEMTDDTALLLVLATRPERDHPVWELRQRAAREHGHRTRELDLEPLGDDAERGLLAGLVGEETLPESVRTDVLDRAEGNPFYLEEIVRALADSGALAQDAGGWRFEVAAPVEIPETVEKVVLARVDRLEPRSHEVLAAAAVLGRQFGLPLLEEVAGPDGVAEALRDLQRLDLVRQERRWPEPEYRFRHSLIQEATYRSLLKRRREQLHRQAARALASRLGEGRDDLAGMLAQHYHAAGEFEAALEQHTRAATAAASVHALDEALAQLDGALAAAAALGLGPEDRRVAMLHRDRGGIRYDYTGDFAGSRADLEAALEGARAFGDAGLEVQALLTLSGVERAQDGVSSLERLLEAVAVAEAADDPSLQVAALSRLCIHRSVLLELEAALACGNRALEIAGQANDPAARPVALDAVKLVAGQLGDLTLLDSACSEILAGEDGEAVRPGYRMEARGYRAWTLQEWAAGAAATGDWELAEARARQAIEENREIGGVSHHPVFLDALARVQRSPGDYGAALRTAREACARAHGIAHREWAAWTDATLGWVLMDLRSVDLAAEALDSGLREAERGNAPWRRVLCLGLLAWARAALGQPEAAAELAAQGEQALAAVTLPPGGAFMGGAPAYLGIARAHLAIGDPQRAEATLRPIAESAERLGWREYAAAALLVGGLAAAAREDPDAARARLSGALDIADDIGLPGVAWEAHAALASLAGLDAAEHAATARAEVQRIAAGVDDQAIRDRFVAGALGSLDVAAA